MVGKLLCVLTVSCAALAPLQPAMAQADTTLAEAAVYGGTESWHRAIVEPGVTYFYLSGSDGAELDLFVYDGFGRLLASDENPGDQAAVKIWTRQRMRVMIEVRNVGKLDSKYFLDMEGPSIIKR